MPRHPKALTKQIVTCGRQRLWKEALKLLQYAITNNEVDVITYSATISACEKGQQWITAVSLLREVQRRNKQTNVITCIATVSTCQKGQQWFTGLACCRRRCTSV